MPYSYDLGLGGFYLWFGMNLFSRAIEFSSKRMAPYLGIVDGGGRNEVLGIGSDMRNIF